MSSKLATLCALSTVIVSGRALAQGAPPQASHNPQYLQYPPQYLAHVSIQAAQATELEVVPAGEPEGSFAVARCKEYCEFWALPGKYTLYARVHGDDEPKRLSLRIKESSRFLLDPGDREGRATGLAVATVGSVALLAGMGMMLAALSQNSESENGSSNGSSSLGIGGLATFLAGGVLTPMGWVIYANNRSHLYRTDTDRYSTAGPQKQIRVGLVGLGLGAFGLGGAATF